jgi:hypothetical protein
MLGALTKGALLNRKGSFCCLNPFKRSIFLTNLLFCGKVLLDNYVIKPVGYLKLINKYGHIFLIIMAILAFFFTYVFFITDGYFTTGANLENFLFGYTRYLHNVFKESQRRKL